MARRRKRNGNVKLGVGALAALVVVGSVVGGGSDDDKTVNNDRGDFGSSTPVVAQQEEVKDSSTVQAGGKTYTVSTASGDGQTAAEKTDTVQPDNTPAEKADDTPKADPAPKADPTPSTTPVQSAPAPATKSDPSPTQQSDAQTDKVYVGSKESDKYHKPTCRYAKNILDSNQRWFSSAEDAAAAGYSPCGTCKPK